MGVKIQWIDPNIDPLDTVEIWRAATKTGSPVKIGTVAGSVREFQDDTAPRNKVSWYSINAVLGQDAAMSKPFPVGNFPDTGPGPKEIMRGDWEFGIFGEVATNMVPDFQSIKDATGLSYTTNPTKFYKWIINGRIVYIPNVPYNVAAGTGAALVNGICLPPNGGIESKIVLDKDGYSFVPRPPFLSNNFTTEITKIGVGGDETLKLTEMAAIVSSVVGIDTGNVFNELRWADNASPGSANWYVSNTYHDSGTQVLLAGLNASASVALTQSTSVARALWPVYELLTV